MLRRLDAMRGYEVMAEDGYFGTVHDFLIDPAARSVPRIVVDTGGWLLGKRVLVQPSEVPGADGSQPEVLPVRMRKDEIKEQPDETLAEPGWRSLRQITGMEVRAAGKRFGKLKDLIVDERWSLREAVVDTDPMLESREEGEVTVPFEQIEDFGDVLLVAEQA